MHFEDSDEEADDYWNGAEIFFEADERDPEDFYDASVEERSKDG